jgi:hypothetical protein
LPKTQKEKGMSNNPFSKPAAASGIQWEDHIGRLLLIEPIALETGINTNFGEKDAVRADITVVDAPDGPQEHTDALIFPSVLISQTRSLIGEKVLGRLAQGVAKPGQKPPWRIEDATDDDVAIGVKYLDSRKPANPFASAQSEVPF